MRSKMFLGVLAAVLFGSAAFGGESWFEPSASVAGYRPKGPTHCFRQFNVDWSWIALRPEQIPEFLSEADPVAFADFCARTHIDGTVVMAVPHHGYCTHATRVGVRFPGMKGDWFGRTIEELHRRRIAAFGYVTLNWNWKFMRDNLGRDFIHGKPDPDGVFSSRGLICLNAPGYLELVEAYTREVLENYPVDGMRWDILSSAKRCTCEGCRRRFLEMYGRELVRWEDFDERRHMEFYLSTTRRVVERLHALCKGIKPSVEIWQNSIQSYHDNDLNIGRPLDIAYNEYGDPFRLLFLCGVLDKAAAINGLMNRTTPIAPLEREAFRWSLALGGRCYSYFGHKLTDHRSLMPSPGMLQWHAGELAPFYAMVEDIEPWLVGARPVAHLGVVFCENTRNRFKNLDRAGYIGPMQKFAEERLRRCMPPAFLNSLDLSGDADRLGRYAILVVPQTSGMDGGAVMALRRYAEGGGALLVAGDALRHDPGGAEGPDFAMAEAMGVSFQGIGDVPEDAVISGQMPGGAPPPGAKIARVVRVEPRHGDTHLWLKDGQGSWPLFHVNRLGSGRVGYLASLDSDALLQAAVDSLAGPAPITVAPDGFQAVLTEQPDHRRWILHLIGDGDCSIRLDGRRAPARRVAGRYPPDGWDCTIEETAGGPRLEVRGPARDRLVILE